VGTFRRATGADVGIALDLNFNFKPEAARRIAEALEPYRLMWLEIDLYDERALRELKDAAPMPICSGENLYGIRDYRRFLDARALDVAMVDVPWNGFARSRDVALLAETHEINIAPHNYYSHLSTLHSLHLCATVPNVRIMEIDVDDVPWKDELVTHPPVVEEGHVLLPGRPGWGADLDEAVARKHVWQPGRLPGYSDAAMYRR
jgi:L-alanine-DL-glutamate epimerase-like enolase superfamily enzyme